MFSNVLVALSPSLHGACILERERRARKKYPSQHVSHTNRGGQPVVLIMYYVYHIPNSILSISHTLVMETNEDLPK